MQNKHSREVMRKINISVHFFHFDFFLYYFPLPDPLGNHFERFGMVFLSLTPTQVRSKPERIVAFLVFVRTFDSHTRHLFLLQPPTLLVARLGKFGVTCVGCNEN